MLDCTRPVNEIKHSRRVREDQCTTARQPASCVAPVLVSTTTCGCSIMHKCTLIKQTNLKLIF